MREHDLGAPLVHDAYRLCGSPYRIIGRAQALFVERAEVLGSIPSARCSAARMAQKHAGAILIRTSNAGHGPEVSSYL